MSAPFMGQTPFEDPSQVFGGDQGEVSADEQQMPGDPNAMQGPPGQPPPTGEPEQDPIDLEGAIAHAIEAGCETATAALETSAEDFQRFCAGVESLANALNALQPNPNPTDPAMVQAIQRQTAADQTHERETRKIALEASRPATPQSSARG